MAQRYKAKNSVEQFSTLALTRNEATPLILAVLLWKDGRVEAYPLHHLFPNGPPATLEVPMHQLVEPPLGATNLQDTLSIIKWKVKFIIVEECEQVCYKEEDTYNEPPFKELENH